MNSVSLGVADVAAEDQAFVEQTGISARISAMSAVDCFAQASSPPRQIGVGASWKNGYRSARSKSGNSTFLHSALLALHVSSCAVKPARKSLMGFFLSSPS